MAMHLEQSTVVNPQYQSNSVSITKKISHYIFRFDDKIGQGNFSKVYKGVHQLTNEQVAIKIVQLSSVKSAKLQELLFSEIEIIQSLNHPNILKCHEVLKSENNCYIITELCNGGDLQSMLKKQKCLNQITAIPYIRDIYKGLHYLGERGIVHRDLKIANIFLHNGTCKIADFGFARYTNKYSQNFFDLDIGSPLYMSPEGMIEHMYGMKTDIWAFGIIIYELLHGKTPFAYCMSQYQLKRAVVTPISYHSLRPDLSNQLRQLIIKCLVVNHSNRPDALALKNDIFLQRILMYNNNNNNINSNNSNINNDQQRIMKRTDQSAYQSLNVSVHDSKQRQNYTQRAISHGPYVGQNMQNTNPIVMNQMNQNENQYMSQNMNKQVGYLTVGHENMKMGEIDYNSPMRGPSQKSSKASQNNSNLKTITKNQYLKSPQQTLNFMQVSPTINKNRQYSHSYGNIPQVNSSFIDAPNYINYPKHETDRILVPQQHTNKLNEKLRSISRNQSDNPQYIMAQKANMSIKSNDNFNKTTNSFWSNNNDQNKKKIPKTYSYQNVNKIQNNLSPVVIHPQAISNSPLHQSETAKMQRPIQKSQGMKSSQKLNNSISNKGLEIKVHELSNGQSCNYIQMSFQQDTDKSARKFGEIIKGEKKPEGNVKSIIKLQKGAQSETNFFIQRSKTKSQIQYAPASMIEVPQTERKRMPRNNHQKTPDFNDNEPMTSSVSQTIIGNRPQMPSFIQQKSRMKQQLKRNLIFTIIQFKEAVGFLHYCRLYFRFISTLRNIQFFPEVKKHDLLIQFFKNSQQNIEIYSCFLITSLNELIQNIKCKEILYDGQNYKKKKLKQDKLKEVTEEYFRKYMEEINKNLPINKKILPTNIKSTSISFMKEHNENFWEQLDREWNYVVQMSRKTQEISENFMKNFRNICYFSIRIIQANDVIISCIHAKKYTLLADAMIQNWLGQEFYSDETYLKLKNKYFRRIRSFNALQKSETNDTETENKSRVNNLTLDA